ncbi:efflux RND transporter permease subunit [Sulfurospirillum deleyianum]|uniref:Acriflavin resistance AcrB/AcrD/AcrF family protein n=1 Tax=Sulfurospirillum deleyianum (strain ATCC 51133 / DSM 6946 / 5175) TaxID=525898 RepID=D1B038_SULD5|nr:efflux RND transporter permease subunit [Sulfurospirillum deleyianum]ACZ11655.1 acriflavin resistance AcrB/AcrD/AcrF family protein [Sulfurospirillum deleyianum DSM 6946]
MRTYKEKYLAGYLARLFLRNPLTMILGVTLISLGVIALLLMPREEDPQISISGGMVMVSLPGASAAEIEQVVVRPLERRIKEIKGVEHIYGISSDNVGIVNVMYYIGENREASNLKLYDKVMQNMNQLPKGASTPLVKPFDIDIDIPILSIAFYAKDSNQQESVKLYKHVEAFRNTLGDAPNLAKTELKGEHKEQFNIEVDLFKLGAYHLGLEQISSALSALSTQMPEVSNHTKEGKWVVFGVKNVLESVEDIENVMVAHVGGSAIYLKDVARISLGYDQQNLKNAQMTYRQSDGSFTPLQEQVTLSISKLKGSNAVVIAEDVLARLEAYKSEFDQEGIGYIVTRNYGERANEAVNELVFHLLISIVIIALLLIFILGWREGIIVILTVPAILAITIFIAYMSDQTINRITLFAFLLSLGLLVDDVIVVIENIHRHLHSKFSKEKSMDELLIEATDEIGAPTNLATIAIILTMVPMAFVGQMMGEFMKPIPLNVPVAMSASLLIAYIFTPYLARKFLKKPTAPQGENHD